LPTASGRKPQPHTSPPCETKQNPFPARQPRECVVSRVVRRGPPLAALRRLLRLDKQAGERQRGGEREHRGVVARRLGRHQQDDREQQPDGEP
jgi:hypothetical protein